MILNNLHQDLGKLMEETTSVFWWT